ncbi:hypothetical protein LTR37_003211 [Vermiconidia calcicola]|uniref:Uncharacterized protein n=1 Tax=Vermiconidia calcicola TaxID=1690605 RepID=A0ACC3NRG2_9PEZI|nr:hypothetical protein LTR37_003211 [Vermiconidia calcicola]
MSTESTEASESTLQNHTIPSQQQASTEPSTSTNTQQHLSDSEMNNSNAEIHHSDPMNMDGPSDLPTPATANHNILPEPQPTPTHHPAVIEPRIPQKKDASLREFMAKMDDYAPLIPDAVTDYYLTLAGLPPPPETDRRLARLLALATQKFIADVAADAYQYSRIRSTNTTSNNPLTGLGGAAGFGTMNNLAEGEGAGKGGKKDAGKNQPLGGPRAGYGGGGGAGGGQGRTVLTMEDLGMAVGEYGVNVKRGEFYR